jgi:hypothetical protein
VHDFTFIRADFWQKEKAVTHNQTTAPKQLGKIDWHLGGQ